MDAGRPTKGHHRFQRAVRICKVADGFHKCLRRFHNSTLPRSDYCVKYIIAGIAIYFTRNGKALAMACDRYMRAEENMNSLRLALEAMRQLERHGGGVVAEKAFAGFVALPAPKRAHEILGVTADADEAAVRKAWRTKIAGAHPDQIGTHAAAAEINAARDDMLRNLAGPRVG